MWDGGGPRVLTIWDMQHEHMYDVEHLEHIPNLISVSVQMRNML